jgi:hypothetical protein
MDTILKMALVLLATAVTAVTAWCIILLVRHLSFFKRFAFFRRLNNYIRQKQKCAVMDVWIDWSKGTIACHDWVSQEIPPFCGKFTWELWDEILPYIRTSENAEGKRETHIFIIKDWTASVSINRKGKKFDIDRVNWLAYCEPISEYIKNKELLRTGNGYKHYYLEKHNDKEKPLPLIRDMYSFLDTFGTVFPENSDEKEAVEQRNLFDRMKKYINQ